jgi:hypothetical protein
MKTNDFSTAFCVFMTEICIFLFYFVSASKLSSLLIKANAAKTNRNQREIDSNGAIATSDFISYSTMFAKLTNLFKQKGRKSRPYFPSPFGEGLGVRFTNRMQMDFLFNNRIQSQRGVLSLRAAEKCLRGESCFYPIISTFIFASPSATCKSVSCPARTTQAIGPSRAPR